MGLKQQQPSLAKASIVLVASREECHRCATATRSAELAARAAQHQRCLMPIEFSRCKKLHTVPELLLFYSLQNDIKLQTLRANQVISSKL